jgi:excisionase family DNA binding protein
MTAFRPSDLARRWNCSERTVRNLISTGALRAFRLGGKLLRVTQAAVDQFEQCRNIDLSSPAVSTAPNGESLTDAAAEQVLVRGTSGKLRILSALSMPDSGLSASRP